MKIIITKNQLLIFFAFAIITVSNAKFIINSGLDNLTAYFGYLLLLFGIIQGYINLSRLYRWNINKNMVIALFVFSIGILVQPMGTGLKIRLLLTMMIITVTALASDGLMKSMEDIRMGAYGLLAGEVLAFILSVITKTELFSNVYEKFTFFGLGMGFDAGMSHKNYFAMVLLASFSGIYIYHKYCKKKLADDFIMVLEIFLIYLSHCRAVWLLITGFFILISVDKIKGFTIRQRRLLKFLGIPILIALFIFSMRWIYYRFFRYSVTYMTRIYGLMNWFEYEDKNWFHLFFGDAATFFGSSLSYYDNFRKITGTSGAVDMAFLNILIKNGFIGLSGYILIFWRIIKQALQTSIIKYKKCLIAIAVPMIISAFSENCVATISIAYAPFCYCILASLYRQCKDEQKSILE